jgi:hypothetical protein
MHALDRRELSDAFRSKPVEEFLRPARIGATRVRVANVGGEEFEEPIGGAGSGATINLGAREPMSGAS